jgi:integrase
MTAKRAKKKKAKRRHGPITRHFSQKLKKWLYGLDVRVSDGNGAKKRIRPTEFETRKEAEEALASIRRNEREGKYGLAPLINRPPLQDLIAKRLQTIASKKERTRSRRVLYTWLSLLDPKLKLDEEFEPANGYRSSIKVDEIDTPRIRKYVEKRQEDGQAPSSVNRELNVIGAMLRQVADFFPEMGQWQPPKVPRLKASKRRRERVITDEEYRKMLAWLTRPLEMSEVMKPQNRRREYDARLRVAAIFRFAMLTGMRPKEIFNLKWDDIDYDGARIRVRATKTENKLNSTRYVPLTEPAREVLEAERKHSAARNCIFTGGGNPNKNLYRLMRSAAESAGIRYGRDTEEGLVLYCARHTFTTRLLQSGLDLRTVGDITGHTDKELVLHYSHVTPESTARATAAIEALESRRMNREGNQDDLDPPATDLEMFSFLIFLMCLKQVARTKSGQK